MGTYTTNYNLFLPTIGEQGWGDLVNGNFATIDTTMKSLSNRITAVENEVNGNLSCTSVTTSGTITSTGVINANGGIKGNATTATNLSRTVTVSSSSTSVQCNYSQRFVLLPYTPGVLFTGSIKGYVSNTSYPITIYILSSSNSWSSKTISSTTDATVSISNVKCAMVAFSNSTGAWRCPQTLKKWGVKRQPTEFRSKIKNLWATQTQE